MNQQALADNPDRRFIVEAIAAGLAEIPIETNPQLRSLSSRLEKASPGAVSISFVAGSQCEQGNGVVSGGALATMLDSAMALSVLSMLKEGQTCASISLTVNMLRPARLGRLIVRAIVDRVGKQVAFASASLTDDQGRPCANASSSLAIFSLASTP